MYIYIYPYICIYIYIYRERERERERDILRAFHALSHRAADSREVPPLSIYIEMLHFKNFSLVTGASYAYHMWL
jgi:hypothetical protein